MTAKLRLIVATISSLAGLMIFLSSPATASTTSTTSQTTSHATSTCNGGAVLLDHSDGAVSVEAPSGCTTPAFAGSMAGKHLNAPIVGMATFPGGGYWLVAADGGIFTFGAATFHGSTGGMKLNAPIVGMASTPDGGGYWLLASDGGVFAFGDAVFQGSMGNKHLNQPMVGIAADGSTGGYWLVASDGGVFAFNAPFLGSMGGKQLNSPIKFITGTPDFGGYRMVGADGGVFNFGDAKFYGSAANTPGTVWEALASSSDGNGYWLFSNSHGSTVTINAYGDAATNLSPSGGDTDISPLVGAASYVGGAPVVTTNPASQSVVPGSSVTFSAAASGSPSVQWEQSVDGGATFTAISGATSPTLTFTASQSESGYQYRALFTNGSGSTLSTAATLTVSASGNIVPSSAGGYFTSISCPTTSECVTVGETAGNTALVEVSANGGSTFSVAPVPATAPALVSVDCNDAAHCVAVGTSSALVSNNGGQTWTLDATPLAGGAPTVALSGVACESDTLCTAVGAPGQTTTYIYSTDGGVTWLKSAPPAGGVTMGAVTCFATACVAVGEGAAVSTDGGATWTYEGTGTNQLISVSCGTAGAACLAVGPNPLGVSQPTATGILDISTNGGATWTQENSNLPASTPTIQGVSCVGSTDCMVVGESPQGPTGTLVIARTTDGGATWTAETGPTGFGNLPANILPQGFPAISCSSGTSCVVAGGNSSGPLISVTANGGQTWTSATIQ